MSVVRTFVYAIMTDQGRGPGAAAGRAVAAVLAAGYGVIVGGRNFLYRCGWLPRAALPCPVISIGNLTVGGVGKTPLTIFLAEHLQARGLRPAVLIRGYMTRAGQRSDEAELLRRMLPDVPVMEGRDRLRNGREVCAQTAVDVILLDDGFQHRRLRRDVDLVAVDALRPFGNGRLLPRGILREGCQALGRADMIILTKTDMAGTGAPARLKTTLSRYAPGVPVFETRHVPCGLEDLLTGESLGLSFLEGKTVGCLAGIGDPEYFMQTVERLGARVAVRWIFPDHHGYSDTDRRRVEEESRAAGVEVIVTTLKDAVKLKTLNLAGPRWLSLQGRIQMDSGEDEFFQGIIDLLHR